jgi:hypothetical protein
MNEPVNEKTNDAATDSNRQKHSRAWQQIKQMSFAKGLLKHTESSGKGSPLSSWDEGYFSHSLAPDNW